MAVYFPFFNKIRRVFKALPVQDQPATTDQVAEVPIEAVSFAQHVGPIFRTPSQYPPHM